MASPDDHRSIPDERGNPFVTFRRFADEQLAALLRTALSFPYSSLSTHQRLDDSPTWTDQQHQQHLQEANEMELLLNSLFKRTEQQHSNTDNQAPFSSLTRQCDPGFSQKEQAETCEFSREGVRKSPFFVGESEHEDGLLRRCPYRPADQDRAASPPAPVVDADILSYLRRLVASPLDDIPKGRTSNLRSEVQDAFRDQSDHVTEAFADLLGIQPTADSSQGSTRKLEKSNEDRVKSFADGSFADPLQSSHNGRNVRAVSDDQSSKDIAHKNSLTELDLYERFLGAQWPGIAIGRSVQNHRGVSGADAGSYPSRITSALTTTEQSTLPDGSVVTKVVLKKRFADGTEQHTETEHTSHNQSQIEQMTRRSQQESDAFLNMQSSSIDHSISEKVQEKRRGGWFWS